jgi:hypothetical protein
MTGVQLRELVAGALGTGVSVLYRETTANGTNEDAPDDESLENEAPPAEVESATNALGRLRTGPGLNRRGLGTKLGLERSAKSRSVPILTGGSTGEEPPPAEPPAGPPSAADGGIFNPCGTAAKCEESANSERDCRANVNDPVSPEEPPGPPAPSGPRRTLVGEAPAARAFRALAWSWFARAA